MTGFVLPEECDISLVRDQSALRGGNDSDVLFSPYISSNVGMAISSGGVQPLNCLIALSASSRIGSSVLIKTCEGCAFESKLATAEAELRGDIGTTVISARSIPTRLVKYVIVSEGVIRKKCRTLYD